MPVQFIVMDPANRNNELVADFPTKRTRLGETQMVRIRWGSAAHNARLASDKLTMALVAQADRLGGEGRALEIRATRGVLFDCAVNSRLAARLVALLAARPRLPLAVRQRP